jgi:O-antigen biosynthesis protein WbqP
MKRFFDLLLITIITIIFFIPLFIVSILVLLSSEGSILYWSDRVGRYGNVFKMPKFRTMLISTPDVASNLLKNPNSYLTPIGGFLRRTSIDEFPQFISVFRGKMSLVGPRPALFNENDLISLREKKDINKLLPGITGWAQVNGRDNLSVSDKVLLDEIYLKNQSFLFDLKILWMTFIKVINKNDVAH